MDSATIAIVLNLAQSMKVSNPPSDGEMTYDEGKRDGWNEALHALQAKLEKEPV